MTLGVERLELFERDGAERALLALAVTEIHLRHGGEDDQQRGADVGGEHARGQVLVDHGLDTDVEILRVLLDRDSAAAAGDDDVPRARGVADHVALDDPERTG